MGGAGAPGNLEEGAKTQVWLAVSDDKEALVSGKYFYHKKIKSYHPAADDLSLQQGLLKACSRISGVTFPN